MSRNEHAFEDKIWLSNEVCRGRNSDCGSGGRGRIRRPYALVFNEELDVVDNHHGGSGDIVDLVHSEHKHVYRAQLDVDHHGGSGDIVDLVHSEHKHVYRAQLDVDHQDEHD
jgi:hypothetical protein